MPLSRAHIAKALVIWNYIAATIVITLLFSIFVPFHMDEVIHYLWIRCYDYPGNFVTPDDDCTGFWSLNVLGTGLVLPLRVYFYAGAIPSVFYYPIYLLWKSYLSARWLGVLWLLAQSWLLQKLFRLPIAKVFGMLVLFLPYFFQHIVDTGPVAIHITTVFCILWITTLWVRHPKVQYPIYCALLIFLSMWTKLTFGWLLPGIGILQALLVFENRKHMKKFDTQYLLNQIYLGVIVCVMCVSVLLFSSDVRNPLQMPLLEQLIAQSNKTYSFVAMMNDIQVLPALQMLLHPLQTANRIFEIPAPGALAFFYSIMTYGSLPFVVWVLLAHKRIAKREALHASFGYGAFLLTLFLIAKNREVWTMHHTVLALPFIVYAWCALFSGLQWNNQIRNSVFGAVSVFFVLNLYFFVSLQSLPIRSEADPSRMHLNQILSDEQLASNYMYITVDRGMYFLQATYGHPNQSNIFREPLASEWQIEEIRDALRRNERRALFIFDTKARLTDVAFIQEHFMVTRCNAVPRESVWQIVLEPGEEAGVCL